MKSALYWLGALILMLGLGLIGWAALLAAHGNLIHPVTIGYFVGGLMLIVAAVFFWRRVS